MWMIGGALLGLAVFSAVIMAVVMRGVRGALMAPILPLVALFLLVYAFDVSYNDPYWGVTEGVMLWIGVPLLFFTLFCYGVVVWIDRRRDRPTEADARDA